MGRIGRGGMVYLAGYGSIAGPKEVRGADPLRRASVMRGSVNSCSGDLCRHTVEACWLTAVVAVPLFFNSYSFRVFETEKTFLVTSVVCVGAIAWALRSILEGPAAHKPQARAGRNRPLQAPLVLVGICYVLSTIFSIAPRVSLW